MRHFCDYVIVKSSRKFKKFISQERHIRNMISAKFVNTNYREKSRKMKFMSLSQIYMKDIIIKAVSLKISDPDIVGVNEN